MKILFTLTTSFNPNAGGVQRTTYKLGKYFTEQGIDVYYFSFSSKNHIKSDYGTLFFAYEEGLDNNTNNINYLKEIILMTVPDVVINQMPYEKKLRETLYELKKTRNYLLLGCLRNSMLSVINNIEAYAKNIIPYKFHLLFLNIFGKRILEIVHRRRHKNYLKSIIDYHDYFILLAPPNIDELKYFVGDYKLNKIVCISNSIQYINKSISKKENIVLYVGRIDSKQKRADLILPIWKKVSVKLNEWRLIIIGTGEYFNKLEKQVLKNKISRVELKGRIEPFEFYEKASIFMMTSAYEGFPNVLIEAQSYGVVPVAFNNYPALSWIVNNQKDAVLVEPFNKVKMSEAIINLANDKLLMEEMRSNALLNAERFTIEIIGQQWMDFLRYNGVKC